MAKELKDKSFDELVDFCAWNVVQGLLCGEPLRAIIYNQAMIIVKWRTDKDR